MERTNKHTVLKEVRNNGEWKGVIAPSKARPGGPWNLGHEIAIRKDNFKYFVWNGEESMELESYLNNFAYYNCNSELGQRISFWK